MYYVESRDLIKFHLMRSKTIILIIIDKSKNHKTFLSKYPPGFVNEVLTLDCCIRNENILNDYFSETYQVLDSGKR